MSECLHKKITKKAITKKYFGLDFNTQMEICENCHANLWTPETDLKFNQWLTKLTSTHRDNLTLQIHVNMHTSECLSNLAKRFPGTQTSSLIRALVSVFINVVLEDQILSQKIEAVTAGEIFKSFMTDEGKKKYNIFFKPTALLDIDTWAKQSDLTHARFVEEAVSRILAMCYESEPELKEFWLTKIFPQLEMIMKAS